MKQVVAIISLVILLGSISCVGTSPSPDIGQKDNQPQKSAKPQRIFNAVWMKWTPSESIGEIIYPSFLTFNKVKGMIPLKEDDRAFDAMGFHVVPHLIEDINLLDSVKGKYILDFVEETTDKSFMVQIKYPGKLNLEDATQTVKSKSWFAVKSESDDPSQDAMQWLIKQVVYTGVTPIQVDYDSETWFGLEASEQNMEAIPIFQNEEMNYTGVAYFQPGSGDDYPAIVKASVIGRQNGYFIATIQKIHVSTLTAETATELYPALTKDFFAGLMDYRFGEKL
jgi:hypothetical protein